MRAAAVALLSLVVSTASARADSATTTTNLSKKEAELRHEESRRTMTEAARKKWRKSLERRVGKAPEKVINVFNGWTHENLVVPANGGKPRLSDDEMNSFLRCRYTNKKTEMDPRLLPTAIKAARHFKSDRIVVVSGFRSPKYNLTLIKKGREVSRKSQHKKGKALDFRLDGVSAAALRDWAQRLGMGGVGFYQHSGFVHIDTAHVRYWNGR